MWWAGVIGGLLDGFDGHYDWSQMIKRPDPFDSGFARLLAALPAPDGASPHAQVALLAEKIRALPPPGQAWLEEELHNLGGNPLVRERLVAELRDLVEPRFAGEGALLAADIDALIEAVPESARDSMARMLAALALLVGCGAEPPLELPARFA